MSDYNINKMDFKQLRNEVQLLRDELAIMKRKYEDIIYNLDTDNFSSRFVKEQGDMKTAIEITAEGIKTKVSQEDLDDSLLNYSTIDQTAEKIELAVVSVNDSTDEKLTHYSTIEMTDEQIEMRVGITETDMYSLFSITDDAIKGIVPKNISAKFESSVMPTFNNTTEKEKGMLCEYRGELYYYNDVTNTWKLYPHTDGGVISQFVQTGDGFELTGDVYISGDSIVDGTISADRIDTENLSCTRLYSKGDFGGYSVRLNGKWGDFGIFNSMASDYDGADSTYCMYGVYNSFPNVNFFVYGNNFMGYDVDTDTIWAKGNWNFSAANVDGI